MENETEAPVSVVNTREAFRKLEQELKDKYPIVAAEKGLWKYEIEQTPDGYCFDSLIDVQSVEHGKALVQLAADRIRKSTAITGRAWLLRLDKTEIEFTV